MSGWALIGGVLQPMMGALTPADRVNAARNMPISPLSWLWILLVAVAGVVVVGVAIMLIARWRHLKWGVWGLFHAQADHLGLSAEERDLLAHLASLAGVKDPVAIFTMDDAFNQGSIGFLQSQHLTAMDEQGRAYACALLNLLREKLGFHGASESEDQTLTSTRNIPEGARVTIMHRGRADGFQATVWHSDSMELVVEPEAPVQCQPGEGWLVRLADGGSVWEFDAPVVSTSDGRIVLGHSDNVRFINRRRFPRVPVDKSALLAPFPFIKPDANESPPTFRPARLVEIAGPGLRLETEVQLQPGEKALVVLKLQDGKVVEALGKVRRTLPGKDSPPTVIVELIGLNSAEVAELTRQTNAAAQDAAAQEAPDQEEAEVATSAPV
jgi:hypothetical protein